ncbi:MAG: hypothetical protein ACLUV5_10245 [Oscillospiraceae bacterium]|jgi:hypothetical protein
MADEVGSAALQSGQKIIEVGAELIKLLAPLFEKMLKELYHNSVESINQIGGSIAERLAKGTVTNGELLYEANKAECGISTTSNILSADAKAFAAKAKEYKISVAVVGNGDKQTIEFLDRDKGIVNQITQEIMQERLKEAPQSVKCFNISANNVTAMKAAFEEQGLSCQFMKSADGKIKCVYPAENAEQVAVVKEDYKRVHGEISDDLDIRSDDKGIVIADDKLGKSFEYSPMNKAQTMELLREQFGYSEAKADLAANKICRDLKQDKDKFLAHTEQYDNLNSLKTNIRYPSDDLTLRDMRFNSVNFKDGGTTHIFISNGDKTAALTPEEMTETEMKNICTNRLGMMEYQAEKAVAKSQKIDRQVKSKIEERTVGKDGVSQSVGIERTSQNGFTLTFGGKSKTYNFSTINVADKISRDFNIPKENSAHIIDKAKKQSVLQNKIQNSLKKQPASPTVPKPKLNESKGLKH